MAFMTASLGNTGRTAHAGPCRVAAVALLLSSMLSTPGLFAADGDGIIEAIKELSHHSFSVRTRAEHNLLRIGSPAQEALIDALDHDDPETRRSARRILEQIQNDRLYLQVRQFTTQGPDAATPPLPGWSFYREHVGDDAQARSDFVEAVLAEPVLLESLDQDPTYSSQALQSRTQTLYNVLIRNPGQNPSGAQGPGASTATSTGSVAALLIVAANNATAFDEQTAQKIFQLMNYSGLTQNLMPDEHTPHRRLVGHFVRRSAGTSLAYQMLWLSMQYNLPEGLIPAETIIREKTPQPYVLQNAMLGNCQTGRHRASRYFAGTLPLNDDQPSEQPADVVDSNPSLRDVALAATIHLHGERP